MQGQSISHAVAHHLLAIAELHDDLGYARVSDVARKLSITRGAASLTLRSLKQRGLVEADHNRFIRLSDEGQAIARGLRAKKGLLHAFFAGLLGVDEAVAEEDACRIEHLLSDQSATQLVKLMRFLTVQQSEAGEKRLYGWLAAREGCEATPERCAVCEKDCLCKLFGEDHD
ncbi:MAG: metal-dependent transcriptional regulator [Deltaproteobacteria bacterium]|nr:metal-dependent transcriptional regulator [Deltaproteobacteria bacterium]